MNKQDAREYAARLVEGYIERLSHEGDEPLVYDLAFDPSIQGKRLSRRDHDRVCNAVVASATLIKGQPDGKPGPRWKGYKSWLDKQGWRVT